MCVFVQLFTISLCFCSKRGFDVRSFGTGTHVKLPGPAPDKPNVYDFKTTYEQMYSDLVRKDKDLYPELTDIFIHTHTHTHTSTSPFLHTHIFTHILVNTSLYLTGEVYWFLVHSIMSVVRGISALVQF
uniref:RNA polymerase II subunit A C-terminal domain phosphatase SSU72 n=1 Tax=Astyanax mexicanus TaxID=7994 RepID=A0A8B9LDI3_ASTMX